MQKMAKQITQETFDAAVQENMELLEMNEEDAIAEAIQQFEAQVKWQQFYNGIRESMSFLGY